MQHLRLTFHETEENKYDQDSGAQNYAESIKKNAEDLGVQVGFSKSFGFPLRETFVDLWIPDSVDHTLLTGDRTFTTIEEPAIPTDVNEKGDQ